MLKDEIDEVRKQVNKLRNENVELKQKATLASVYAEELDTLRERVLRVDKYESDVSKLKDQIDTLQHDNTRLDVSLLLIFVRFAIPCDFIQ